MENKKASKLIDKILDDLDKTGINTDTLIEDIKELRTYALEEQIPLVVKVLRFTYEHIEKNNSFLIPIPDDEPIDDEDSTEEKEAVDPIESLKYLISLTKSLKNRMNISDLKEYRDALMEY
ncbi:hypothetical protein [Aquimarina muelleri]|uniref:Uncharacterized protein n=1 Tax=Aquimarina muelleri TaxID=279356 RepID=A0A918JUF5_9FLAO|nr:hypothetical protein [Aquimarina muelleri]MCX2762077.1 hypothetical protein [Aquimarina muelleri]GGX04277.1 hypothetical protein GCM10007384_02590 [Aquimarina muelleri]